MYLHYTVICCINNNTYCILLAVLSHHYTLYVWVPGIIPVQYNTGTGCTTLVQVLYLLRIILCIIIIIRSTGTSYFVLYRARTVV